MHTKAMHHFHKRKRVSQKKFEDYPSRKRWIRFLDKMIYLVGVAGPIMTIPQLMKVWIDQSAGDLSLISWFSFLIIALIWTVYGIVHKEKPIIVAHGSWAIMHVFVVIGILLYG